MKTKKTDTKLLTIEQAHSLATPFLDEVGRATLSKTLDAQGTSGTANLAAGFLAERGYQAWDSECYRLLDEAWNALTMEVYDECFVEGCGCLARTWERLTTR